MSNSGSPGGHAQLLHQPQGSPIPGSNLVVRPPPARSPYEWMKRPSSGMHNKTSKEGMYCMIVGVLGCDWNQEYFFISNVLLLIILVHRGS